MRPRSQMSKGVIKPLQKPLRTGVQDVGVSQNRKTLQTNNVLLPVGFPLIQPQTVHRASQNDKPTASQAFMNPETKTKLPADSQVTLLQQIPLPD